MSYGLVIYNPKLNPSGKPELSAQIKLYKDGKTIYEGKPQPVSTDNGADPKRVNTNGSLNFGTDMTVGDYILQIIVTDNLANKKRQTVSQFVPFEIVD